MKAQAQSTQAAAKKAKRITWQQLVLSTIADNFAERTFTRKELLEAIEAEAFALFPRNGNYQNTVAQQLTKLTRSGELIRVKRGLYALPGVELPAEESAEA